MFELGVVDGEERSVVTGVAQRMDQTHEALDGVGTQSGRRRHHNQRLTRGGRHSA